jgi:formylglycine-generating enzyme required for sulfatase activity
MNINAHQLIPILCLAFVAAPTGRTNAQAPNIQSFRANGQLRGTNLEPGTTAAIEWAPEITGPWNDSWDSLTAVPVQADGSIEVKVPMFYRLRGIPANPDSARLVWIPPGTFTMGSPEDEPEREPLLPLFGLGDETEHVVTISRGFWMAKFELTQRQYQDLVGSNPSFFSGETFPVENVTWFEALDFCVQLTEHERSAGRLPEGYVYRLPTEAEWEYACRAGTTSAFHYGPELRSVMENFRGTVEYSALIGRIDNPNGIFLGQTTPVGDYESNAWGLHDMHGNVWEWCHDWTGPYPSGSVVDPSGPASGQVRSSRGGSWEGQRGAVGCRSAMRNYYTPDDRLSSQGFRVVLAPPIP